MVELKEKTLEKINEKKLKEIFGENNFIYLN